MARTKTIYVSEHEVRNVIRAMRVVAAHALTLSEMSRGVGGRPHTQDATDVRVVRMLADMLEHGPWTEYPEVKSVGELETEAEPPDSLEPVRHLATHFYTAPNGRWLRQAAATPVAGCALCEEDAEPPPSVDEVPGRLIN